MISSPAHLFLQLTQHIQFRNIHRKQLCLSLLLINFFIEKRLQHRCFLVNFAKLLGTAFFIEHLRWLLLQSFALSACSIFSSVCHLLNLLEKLIEDDPEVFGVIICLRPSIVEGSFIVIRRIWIFVGNIAAFYLEIIKNKKFDTLFLTFPAFLFLFGVLFGWNVCS